MSDEKQRPASELRTPDATCVQCGTAGPALFCVGCCNKEAWEVALATFDVCAKICDQGIRDECSPAGLAAQIRARKKMYEQPDDVMNRRTNEAIPSCECPVEGHMPGCARDPLVRAGHRDGFRVALSEAGVYRVEGPARESSEEAKNDLRRLLARSTDYAPPTVTTCEHPKLDQVEHCGMPFDGTLNSIVTWCQACGAVTTGRGWTKPRALFHPEGAWRAEWERVRSRVAELEAAITLARDSSFGAVDEETGSLPVNAEAWKELCRLLGAGPKRSDGQ